MKIFRSLLDIINREMPLKILEKRGLKVGKNFSKQKECFLDPNHCFLIEIGDNVTFSNRVTLLAHDASSKKLIQKTKFGKIIIHNNVFVGANVTILPNVEIGENTIIGAGSVVTKNIEPNKIVAGNPAKVIDTVESYREKLNKTQRAENTFGKEYTIQNKVDQRKKEELKKASKKYGICYID